MKHSIRRACLLVGAAFCMPGCTTYWVDGRKVLQTSADIESIEIITPSGARMITRRINHSAIHRAIGNNVVKTVPAIGTAIATAGLVP